MAGPTPMVSTHQLGWLPHHSSRLSFMVRCFHTTPPGLVRRTRDWGRPKSPPHPGVPSYKLSPDEPDKLSSLRKRLMGIKERKNLDEFAWKKDSGQNVLRRKDGITGKFVHSKIDWIGDPKRKFLKSKQQQKLLEEDSRYVQQKNKQFSQTTEEENEAQTLPPRPVWQLPRREWNLGAASLVHEYGREYNPLYSFEQRKALARLRERALEHEKKRQGVLSQGDQSMANDEEFWDYESNFRSPLYDFFRGAQVLEGNSVSDSKFSHWSVAQLRRKSFEDLHILWYVLLKERNLLLVQRLEARKLFSKMVNPADPGEPLSTIRSQLKAVQYSLRNIKLTVCERQLAIKSRGQFLAKYQSKRSKLLSSQQWYPAFEIEKSKLLLSGTVPGGDGQAVSLENINEFFKGSIGRGKIRTFLRFKRLTPGELRQNMKAFDQFMRHSALDGLDEVATSDATISA